MPFRFTRVPSLVDGSLYLSPQERQPSAQLQRPPSQLRHLAAYCANTAPPAVSSLRSSSEARCRFSLPPLGSSPLLPWTISAHEVECWVRCLFDTPNLSIYAVDDAKTESAAAVSSEPRALFVPLPKGAYRATPFLDSRSLSHTELSGCQYTLPLADLRRLGAVAVAAAADADADADAAAPAEGSSAAAAWGLTDVHYIFHLSHVASTVLSRALDDVPQTLVLREPHLVRWAADTWLRPTHESAEAKMGSTADVWRELLLPYLGRRYDAASTVVVKAPSTALGFARTALEGSAESRIVFMWSALRTWLAVCMERLGDGFPTELYDGLDATSGGRAPMPAAFLEYSGTSPAPGRPPSRPSPSRGRWRCRGCAACYTPSSCRRIACGCSRWKRSSGSPRQASSTYPPSSGCG